MGMGVIKESIVLGNVAIERAIGRLIWKAADKRAAVAIFT